jgi:hypothetical protein
MRKSGVLLLKEQGGENQDHGQKHDLQARAGARAKLGSRTKPGPTLKIEGGGTPRGGLTFA